MWITIILLLLIILLIYTFLIWNFSYWKKRNIKGPKPTPFVGNFPSVFTQKRHMILDFDDIYRQFKDDEDFVGTFNCRSPQLLILSPELCRRVLVTDFKHFHDNEASSMADDRAFDVFSNNPFMLTGERWKQSRTLITPGLSIGRIKAMYPVTNKVCKRMSDYVKKQMQLSENSGGIDAKDISLRFTSDTVTDCVLGLNAKSFEDDSTPVLKMVKRMFEGSFRILVYIALVGLVPSLKKIYKMDFIPKDCEKFFIDLMENAINVRKSQSEQRNDFLNFMLDLKEKKNMNTLELTSHTMTFLLDGFETTATVVSHSLLLLARDAGKQEKLRAEIKEHLDENGIVDFDKLQELPYLDACIHETIRLFPPGLVASKLCTEPIEFEGKSGRTCHLCPGDVVVLPLYSIMTDENYYKNAKEFDPERFLHPGCSVKEYRERGLYYGFADGPRICIGMRFALTQVKAVLVEMITNFNIKVNPKTRTDNRFDPAYFLLRLDGGIWLDFEALK